MVGDSIKICNWCGEEFEVNYGNEKYCCDKHRKEAWLESDRKRRRKYYKNNKKRVILSQIGTTTMSPHRNLNFAREIEIVRNEKKKIFVTTVYKGKNNYFKGRIRFTQFIPKTDEVQLGTQQTHNYATFDDYVNNSVEYWMTNMGPCPECESKKRLKDLSRCDVSCECGLGIAGAPHSRFKYPDNTNKLPKARYSHEYKNLKLKMKKDKKNEGS
jgi:hypothetical protein